MHRVIFIIGEFPNEPPAGCMACQQNATQLVEFDHTNGDAPETNKQRAVQTPPVPRHLRYIVFDRVLAVDSNITV